MLFLVAHNLSLQYNTIHLIEYSDGGYPTNVSHFILHNLCGLDDNVQLHHLLSHHATSYMRDARVV